MHKCNVLWFPLLLLICSCSALGLWPAESFNERVAYAIGSHTAVLQATTSALNARDITSDEAQQVASIADNSRLLIDTALRVKASGDNAGADKTLAMAVSILQQLQEYLRGRHG